ncbi:hypothetical protein OKW40_007039 [Paraburkholderia sp. RAU6.4a]
MSFDWQGQPEYRSARLVLLSVDASAVGLRNRPADCKAHAHALRFRRIKRLEQVWEVCFVYSDARVANLYEGIAVPVDSGVTVSTRWLSTTPCIASMAFTTKLISTCCT